MPLTTKIKDNKFYHTITVKNKDQSAMLSQIRVWESKRITHKMGEIGENEFEVMKKKIREMI